MLLASAFWLPSMIKLRHTLGTAPGSGGTVHTGAIRAGACLITLVGAIDDVWPLRPQWKLLGQIAAAILKFKTRRAQALRTAEPDTSEHEIDGRVQREIEMGDFEQVG